MNNHYVSKEIRSSAILTWSYVAATVMWQSDANAAQELNQFVCLVDFTIWSLTTLEIKIEFSDDWVTYFQETASSISWGTATMTALEYSFAASGNFIIASPFKAKFVRVSAKWTGTATSSTLALTWILGVS